MRLKQREQAIRAGLELCATVGAARPGAGRSTGCRIGVATGVVLIGNRNGDRELRPEEIVGSTPILAARLQSSAQPDTVVADAVTHRLIGTLFDRFSCCGAGVRNRVCRYSSR